MDGLPESFLSDLKKAGVVLPEGLFEQPEDPLDRLDQIFSDAVKDEIVDEMTTSGACGGFELPLGMSHVKRKKKRKKK